MPDADQHPTMTVDGPTRTAAGWDAAAREPYYGPARLLAGDLRTLFLLANEARYQALERVLGVSRENANLVTFVIAVVLAEAGREQVRGMLTGPGGPNRADALLGAATARELLYDLAGPSSRQTPYFGALMALALVGGLSGPTLKRSLRGAGAGAKRARRAFNSRYGYVISLLDPERKARAG